MCEYMKNNKILKKEKNANLINHLKSLYKNSKLDNIHFTEINLSSEFTIDVKQIKINGDVFLIDKDQNAIYELIGDIKIGLGKKIGYLENEIIFLY